MKKKSLNINLIFQQFQCSYEDVKLVKLASRLIIKYLSSETIYSTYGGSILRVEQQYLW